MIISPETARVLPPATSFFLLKTSRKAHSKNTTAAATIVNSLTSIDGIVKVKFTIDGKPQKNFKGFIDMREAFIPDYYV